MDIQTKEIGNTALHFAASFGHENIVGMLVHYNASLILLNNVGFTPLTLTNAGNYLSISRMLINRSTLIYSYDEALSKYLIDFSQDDSIVSLVTKEQTWRRRRSFCQIFSKFVKGQITTMMPLDIVFGCKDIIMTITKYL